MNFFRDRFKFGSMRDESEVIREELFSAVKSESRYDSAVNAMYSQLVNGIVKWLDVVFMKYTPQEFHYRMANGFDFFSDAMTNHSKQFKFYMGMARRLRKRIVLDQNNLYNTIIRMLERKGYNPIEFEKQKIY